jgi:leucyl-tRNA synthetase
LIDVSHHHFYRSKQSGIRLTKTSPYEDWARTLLKQTQQFLYAMKKLQKAVHKKEQNVSHEKSDFENSRKDLENTIKYLKKEFESLDKERPINASVEELVQNSSASRDISKLNK